MVTCLKPWPPMPWPTPASTNTATSTAATLTVVSAPGTPAITPNPSPATVSQGGTATFTASSTPPTRNAGESVTYTWYKDSSCSTTPITTTGAFALGGTGNSTLTVNPALLANQGSYYATATETSQGNSSITATSACSSAATLAVTVGNWQIDAPTTTPRYEALSLMLPNGTFWVAGGQNDSGLLNNDAIYTPGTAYSQPTGTGANTLPTNGTWAASLGTGGPNTFVAGPHLDGTATLLPDGEVLIAGGSSGTYAQHGVEIYNPFLQYYRASDGDAQSGHNAAYCGLSSKPRGSFGRRHQWRR